VADYIDEFGYPAEPFDMKGIPFGKCVKYDCLDRGDGRCVDCLNQESEGSCESCRNMISIHEYYDPNGPWHVTETDKFMIFLADNEVDVGNIFEISQIDYRTCMENDCLDPRFAEEACIRCIEGVGTEYALEVHCPRCNQNFP